MWIAAAFVTGLLAGPVQPDAARTAELLARAHPRCQDEQSALLSLQEADLPVPVAHVSKSALQDSFNVWRTRHRRHQAIDILAPTGTPIHAIEDGTILKIRVNRLGGKMVTQLDASGCVGHYYAHLDTWADGLHEGQKIKQGDLIGTVGTTGNAPKNIPHLHLGTYWMQTPGKFSYLRPLNPYRVFVPAVPES
jgi:murein DD-endopeptidase MepM/ murein hydrolase activator NlpD